jgi:phage repressor protein C with HTH and peptisase S24 domain
MLKGVVIRVERRLKKLDLRAATASRAAGLSEDAIRNMQRAARDNSRQGVSTATLVALAPVLKTTVGWLLTGEGDEDASPARIPLVGKVAAEESAEIVYEDAYAQGAAADWLDAPPPEGSIALEVAQSSMAPRFNPGEVLVFGPRAEDPSALLGREVMAKLSDGRAVVKILRKGTRAGRYSLHSYNPQIEPIENAKIDWVLPFEQLRPRP